MVRITFELFLLYMQESLDKQNCFSPCLSMMGISRSDFKRDKDIRHLLLVTPTEQAGEAQGK